MDDDKLRYVTKPTRTTVFLRTFLPWQAWRFAAINLKMIDIIRRSHKSKYAAAPRVPHRMGHARLRSNRARRARSAASPSPRPAIRPPPPPRRDDR